MEIKQHIPVQIYLIFVIYSIIFLSGIGAYAHIPSLSSNVGKFQVSTCNLSVDHSKNSNPNSIACFPCSHKYPLKSYFEKHDSLLDSDFQDFLSLDSCKGMVHNLSSMLRMSLFQRRLNGEGSHRLLVSSMKFDIHSDSIYEQATQDCEAVVIERLPLGVFADPFELQHLVQHGVFVDAAVFGDTNLELPSALSKRSVVEIHINISRSILSWQNKGLNITVEVPLHARYPPLDGSDYSRIEMRLPDLLMRCGLERSHENCLWIPITWDRNSMTSDIAVWQIPCGNRAHAGAVSTVTFVSALVSALSIVFTAIF
ncbi:uncharacterized protein LOC143892921 isoform X3 [Tasmannia lanceolata]|uniref:uncharacterized protein LOC143892921 isoform X3 n=1 Tax=Tasmannia lanceolata TaxID=3420 RepID=UPI004064904D